jgi:DNA-binding CsgD family transcriptional regulator
MSGVLNDSASLSPRELEVLRWVAQGKSSREISVLLGITSRTVNEHVTSTVRKLSAKNRTHAVAIALRAGIIEV